jgi:hypothetical protein
MLARVGQVQETLMTSEAGTTAPVTSAEFVDLLTLAQRAVTRELGVVLQEEPATVDQWRVLRALRGEQGRSMGELAAALEISQPTLTRLVDGLAETANLYRTGIVLELAPFIGGLSGAQNLHDYRARLLLRLPAPGPSDPVGSAHRPRRGRNQGGRVTPPPGRGRARGFGFPAGVLAPGPSGSGSSTSGTSTSRTAARRGC